MKYKNVVIEICGKCNARCKYCYTGRVNRGLLSLDESSWIAPEHFKKTLVFLRETGAVEHNTHFILYNYGEPFLHPNFLDIMRIIDEMGYSFELSTNGSIPLNIDALPYMRNMKIIKYSMCGFSQTSYDRISGLSFSHVAENIATSLELLRNYGWEGQASLKFHVYRYNLNEVAQALHFSIENGMVFTPIHAIIGDLQMQVDYFEGTSDKTFTMQANEDLLTSDMFHLYAREMPNKWECPLAEDLIIDENLNLVNCCMATRNEGRGYYLGNLFDLKKIKLRRCNTELGVRCKRCGVGYAINSFPTYREETWLNHLEQILHAEKIDVVGGDYIYDAFCRFYGNQGVSWNHFIDIEDYLKQSSRELGIIIADSNFYSIRTRLLNQGIDSNKIRAIYNYNLR